jgi:hypothetical protein
VDTHEIEEIVEIELKEKSWTPTHLTKSCEIVDIHTSDGIFLAIILDTYGHLCI